MERAAEAGMVAAAPDRVVGTDRVVAVPERVADKPAPERAAGKQVLEVAASVQHSFHSRSAEC